MSNVIFWSPNATIQFVQRSFGSHVMASWLTQHGTSCDVIDFANYMSVDELVELTRLAITDDTICIGVSTTFWAARHAKNMGFNIEPMWVSKARAILEKEFPNIKWILGGPNSSGVKSRNTWLTFGGAAEDSFLSWVQLQKNSLPRSFYNVKTDVMCYLTDIAVSPHEMLGVEMARGCKFKCKFCSYPLIGSKPGTYEKPYENIKRAVVDANERFGTTRFIILDDTVNEDFEKIKILARIKQEVDFDFQWNGYNRLDLIYSHQGMAELMLESGMMTTFFGIETLHTEASKMVGKPWNGKHAKRYLEDTLLPLWDGRVHITTSFIAGLEPEPVTEFIKNVEWAEEVGIDSRVCNGLFLDVESEKTKSDFEKDPVAYGYTMTSATEWHSKNWTNISAHEVASQLSSRPTNGLTMFHIGEMLTLYHGVPDDQRPYTVGALNDMQEDIRTRATAFTKEYVKNMRVALTAKRG